MEKPAKDGGSGGSSTKSKAKSVGILGLLTILAQYGVGVKNESTQRAAIEDVAKNQILQLQVEQSRKYVEREEIRSIISQIDERLSRIEDRIGNIQSKVSVIDGYLRSKTKINFGDGEYGLNEPRR